MHLHNALDVAYNSDIEGFHNTISNVYQVVMVDAPVLPPHAFPQLKPNLLIEAYTFIKSQVGIPVISNTLFLRPSPEIVRGLPFQCIKVTIISRELLQ